MAPTGACHVDHQHHHHHRRWRRRCAIKVLGRPTDAPHGSIPIVSARTCVDLRAWWRVRGRGRNRDWHLSVPTFSRERTVRAFGRSGHETGSQGSCARKRTRGSGPFSCLTRGNTGANRHHDISLMVSSRGALSRWRRGVWGCRRILGRAAHLDDGEPASRAWEPRLSIRA